MKILIITPVAQTRIAFISSLIPLGYRVYHSPTVKEAVNALQHRKPDSIIIEKVGSEIVEITKFISLAKQLGTVKNVVVLANKVNKEEVVMLIQSGVTKIFVRPFQMKAVISALINIFKRTNMVNEKRQVVRVKVRHENIHVIMRHIVDAKILRGVISDLSARGALVELLDGELKQEGRLATFQFKLNNKTIAPQARVIYKKGNFAGVKFDEITAEDNIALCNFIFEKISAYYE